MSFIGQMFGAKNDFQATGVDPANVKDQFGQLTTNQTQQQAFLQALQAQGGLQNQSNVFQQQQQLAQQLQQQTLGEGPNPAQAQLAQNTASNVQQQAALAAGQRGASANSGLVARQAAMQGAGTQQAATGQAATLQAQQQLSAQQQLQQQQQMLAGLANQQAGQQQNQVNQNAQTALQGYGASTGALNQQNQINAGIAQQNANLNGSIAGGLLGAAGAIGGAAVGGPAGAAVGGGLGKAAGGSMNKPNQAAFAFSSGGKVPRLEKGTEASRRDVGWGKVIMKADGGPVPGKAQVNGDHPKNDTVPAMLSPGELVIPRSVVAQGPEAIMKFAQDCLEEDND